MDDHKDDCPEEKGLDENVSSSVSPEDTLQNSTERPEARISEPGRKRSKGMTNAERQRMRRAELAKRQIGQVNVDVHNNYKKILRFLAKQTLNGQSICPALDHVRKKICPAPQPTPHVASTPKPPTKTPEQIKRETRVLILGEKAYSLRGWRKVLMEIALGI